MEWPPQPNRAHQGGSNVHSRPGRLASLSRLSSLPASPVAAPAWTDSATRDGWRRLERGAWREGGGRLAGASLERKRTLEVEDWTGLNLVDVTVTEDGRTSVQVQHTSASAWPGCVV